MTASVIRYQPQTHRLQLTPLYGGQLEDIFGWPQSVQVIRPEAICFCNVDRIAFLSANHRTSLPSPDLVDGSIVIPPGGSVSLQGTAAAGTSPLVVFGGAFAEEPI
jgi:hypothetical protein